MPGLCFRMTSLGLVYSFAQPPVMCGRIAARHTVVQRGYVAQSITRSMAGWLRMRPSMLLG